MKSHDAKELAAIWLEVSLKAHDFISEHYWKKNKSLMEEQYLPNSEVYIAEEADNIYGFVALAENHIAAIFVCSQQQKKGIGTVLLNYAKQIRQELTLSVYQQNEKSIGFYLSRGFKIVAETFDQPTGEMEFTMHWTKEDL